MSTNRSNGFAFLGGSAPYLPLPLVVGYFQAFCQQKQKVLSGVSKNCDWNGTSVAEPNLFYAAFRSPELPQSNKLLFEQDAPSPGQRGGWAQYLAPLLPGWCTKLLSRGHWWGQLLLDPSNNRMVQQALRHHPIMLFVPRAGVDSLHLNSNGRI